jgi:hypothetical protein
VSTSRKLGIALAVVFGIVGLAAIAFVIVLFVAMSQLGSNK